jgi:hypothetical protein
MAFAAGVDVGKPSKDCFNEIKSKILQAIKERDIGADLFHSREAH